MPGGSIAAPLTPNGEPSARAIAVDRSRVVEAGG